MYKLCYSRFEELGTEYGRPTRLDQSWGIKIRRLEYLEECFTTPNYIVRIYKDKPLDFYHTLVDQQTNYFKV